ncbi:component of SufBCD complex [Psychromarinibacter sp. C21-152]|uniref:Component of SufBCD complex n=1 Tax=Psychromarinibacter sediminicola TaxID=3033385 RepID=A0AAE3T8I9_9RHOB|nr:component of SufBCD complex [Psychromarinibacter sediminicola]MDF0599545.1 component of SufBCD complex [Psychromarinibacter sediminicola]
MDWYSTVFELIDMRSFSNLWYWIALAVVWSSASHWVLGVPYDLVLSAARHEGHVQADLEDLVRINCNRILHIGEVSGLWILGLACAVLSALAVLGFFYWIEFAQALFLILFPLAIVGLLSLLAARSIRRQGLAGGALRRRLRRQRLYTQMIGLVAIFVTAMWGMWQNMTLGALGA